MMKRVSQRFTCLLAAILLTISAMLPTAAAYAGDAAGDEPVLYSPACYVCGARMLKGWMLISEQPGMCNGLKTHTEYTYEYRYICEMSRCTGWRPYDGTIKLEYSCGINH